MKTPGKPSVFTNKSNKLRLFEKNHIIMAFIVIFNIITNNKLLKYEG